MRKSPGILWGAMLAVLCYALVELGVFVLILVFQHEDGALTWQLATCLVLLVGYVWLEKRICQKVQGDRQAFRLAFLAAAAGMVVLYGVLSRSPLTAAYRSGTLLFGGMGFLFAHFIFVGSYVLLILGLVVDHLFRLWRKRS